MAAYELARDEESGIITCRITGPLPDEEARYLGNDIQHAVREARSRRPEVHMLFDNREGIQFQSAALQGVADQLRSSHRPGDRTAILVASSVSKARARQDAQAGHEIFISESAALTWLSAWG